MRQTVLDLTAIVVSTLWPPHGNMSLKLSDFKALSFDCYGTLIVRRCAPMPSGTGVSLIA